MDLGENQIYPSNFIDKELEKANNSKNSPSAEKGRRGREKYSEQGAVVHVIYRTQYCDSATISPIISVCVGNSKIFLLQSAFLIAELDLFSKALHGEFKEATKRRIELENEDPELFGHFVEYLYRDCFILS